MQGDVRRDQRMDRRDGREVVEAHERETRPAIGLHHVAREPLTDSQSQICRLAKQLDEPIEAEDQEPGVLERPHGRGPFAAREKGDLAEIVVRPVAAQQAFEAEGLVAEKRLARSLEDDEHFLAGVPLTDDDDGRRERSRFRQSRARSAAGPSSDGFETIRPIPQLRQIEFRTHRGSLFRNQRQIATEDECGPRIEQTCPDRNRLPGQAKQLRR